MPIMMPIAPELPITKQAGIRAIETENEPFITWENGFTDQELDTIESYCSKLPPDKALISGKSLTDNYTEYRSSKTAWVTYNQETAWLYDKLAFIARQLNSQFYRFDLYGFSEDLQFTIYDSEEKGHYDWHIDSGHDVSVPRKLSLVLQLSDPSTYAGGDLQILTAKDPLVVKRERGLISAFPSYRLHRVTPVTTGIRKTLVVWIAGPAFK